MEYNKNITGKGISKDRPFPFRSGGGPRDQQRRLQTIQQDSTNVNEAVVTELRNQIAQLTQELVKKSKTEAEFTAEEVDEEIRKAISSAIIETKSEFKNKINKLTNRNVELEKEIAVLKASLQSKDTGDTAALTKKIEELTTAVATSKGSEIVADPDRPVMGKVFIDPLSKDSGKNLESHVDIEDSTSEEKVNVDAQVDKLKSLLGKLPDKKN